MDGPAGTPWMVENDVLRRRVLSDYNPEAELGVPSGLDF
jgi:hypothetical protein